MSRDAADACRLRRQSRVIVAAGLVVFLLILTDWQPWNLFTRAGFSTDFYDAQARSFWHGHLAVDPRIPLFEGFVVHGKTYLYYGPFLALSRLPFTLGTHLFDRRLTRLSMLLAYGVTLTWSRRLLERTLLLVRSAPESRAGSGRRRTVLFLAAVAFSPLLFGAAWPSVYHETELWACAFAVVSIVLVLDLVDDPSRKRLWFAIAAVTATVLTRVTVGLGVVGALLIVCVVLRHRQIRLWWTGVVGGAIAVGLHVVVNMAKFGSPFSLPGGKQVLSIMEPKRATWFAGNRGSFFSVRFLTTTIAQYFRPDGVRFERLLPFIRYPPLAKQRGSYPIYLNAVASSLPTTATLLMIVSIVGIVWMVRHRMWMWLCCTASMFVGAVAVFAIGFIANRYLIDILSPLIVAGAIGVWVIPSWSQRRAARVVVFVTAVVVSVWGVWVNVALATWTAAVQKPGFTDLRYSVDDALFGAPSSALLGSVPAQVPREGVVALDTDCIGVYISHESRWVPLDRKQGSRRYSGSTRIPASGQTNLLAMTDGWELRVVNDGSQVAAQVAFPDGTISTSGLPADASEGSNVRVEIVIDPITNEHYAAIDGVVVFVPSENLAGPGAVETPGLVRDAAGGDSLCLTLREQVR